MTLKEDGSGTRSFRSGADLRVLDHWNVNELVCALRIAVGVERSAILLCP
jgi:hypothetical protein